MKRAFFVVIILSIISSNIMGQMKRSEIADKYKWDLSVLYESKTEWNNHFSKLEKKVKELPQFKGKLGNSAETFYNALSTYFNLLKEFYVVYEYAARIADEDLGISKNQEMNQKVSSLGNKISEASAFLRPEILEIDKKKIDKFFAEKEELKEYDFYVYDILRRKAHTLSPKEEKILASAGMLRDGAPEVYGIFDNSEKPSPVVVLSDGKEVELTSANYVKYRATKNREDRAKIFKAFFENYGRFKNTIGANYVSKLKTDYFFAKSRNYNSCLEASLDANNIPVKVYTNLVEQINKNLPTLHRALDLKKKILGLDTLHYYDLYTSMVKSVDMNFTVDEGQKLLLKVFEPLGDEYVNVVNKAFNERWIDYFPTKGKRSGAYSTGAAYDYHPYILMNYTDDYESVSTLAHEIGHTMHSYFSNKTQPFAKADYATFVAEIASTFNENLLNNYLIKRAKTDQEKLYLLGSYLELLRTTIFRQVSFAEFELRAHEKIENGEPLTGESLSNLYYDIVKKYYGHDKGHCIVDPYIAYEWAYIPHFIDYTYYVFQYSTSLIYSTAFAEKVFKEGNSAVDNYFNLLNGGGSDYPIEIIKKAGLDPMSSEPFDLVMAKMNRVIDEIEKLIK